MNSDLAPLIQVYILSYNRVNYIRETIKSLENQTHQNFEIIITDNSTNETVRNFIEQLKCQRTLRYIRRSQLSFIQHMNVVLSEVTADYFLIFHDDDILMPAALQVLSDKLISEDNYSAVGCNAFIIDDNSFTQKLFNPHLTSDRILAHGTEVAKSYVEANTGHVPFPSYMYRSRLFRNVTIDEKNGRKHADVSLVMKAVAVGPVAWLSTPLMYYRRHSSNISAVIELKDIMSLCRYLSSQTELDKKSIQDFKHKHLLVWMKQLRSNPNLSQGAWKDSVFKRSAINFALRNPRVIFKAILKKLRSSLANLFVAAK